MRIVEDIEAYADRAVTVTSSGPIHNQHLSPNTELGLLIEAM